MKNNIKKPLNSFNDIDKKILPFFSNPIILKRIEDKKKNKDLNQVNPQKKLIYKIIKLNEKLVKFTTSIKNYNLNLDSLKLTEVGNKRTETEFILFIRNNLYYNLKFRLSNILYKIEKFLPVLKFNSLLYNINLFNQKHLFKPQPYIRFTYRIIQINNYFNNTNTASPLLKRKGEESKNLFSNYKSILPRGYSASSVLSLGKNNKASKALENRNKVLIKINNYNNQSSFDYSIIQLHKFENGRSIKYILLKLNNLLNEIDNIINIKNKLIKIIKIKNTINFSNFDSILLENVESQNKKKENSITSSEKNHIKAGKATEAIFSSASVKEEWFKEQSSNQSVKNLRLKIKKINSTNKIEISPLLVEETMVKENIIKIEQNIKSILPTLKNNQLNIDDHSSFTTPTNITRQDGAENSGRAKLFNVEKDIIKENSNPVDLLYFNNNLKKPVINQYLKSMSTYNMITNGTILYYSNIIGFNFKKRIRAYLPFIKSISPLLSYPKGQHESMKGMMEDTMLGIRASTLLPTGKSEIKGTADPKESMVVKGRNGERLTSPYTFRGLKKVVGSLDKGKFSVFGRGIENNKLINNIYKFLYLSFKSMYCLISKPVFIIKSNKIIIQLFYFLLIPKIFKHIKSKTNYKWRNKKKVYREFIDRRKKLALAKLFETRLKEKEDALKVKYFLTLPKQMLELREVGNDKAMLLGDKVNRIKPTPVGDTLIFNLDQDSAKSLIKSYNKDLLKIRKTEEENSGVKFDKFGRVIL